MTKKKIIASLLRVRFKTGHSRMRAVSGYVTALKQFDDVPNSEIIEYLSEVWRRNDDYFVSSMFTWFSGMKV